MPRPPAVLCAALLACLVTPRLIAQGFEFTPVVTLTATPVKDQARTGTCWSFATTSFLESELRRLGKGEFDLSEMFSVRQTYPLKAEHYVRMHGDAVFGPGSIAQDVIEVWRRFGAVPEGAYPGRRVGKDGHDHRELDAMLLAMVDVVVEKNENEISAEWPRALAGALDAYLGEVPSTFVHAGKEYTPPSFADSLGLDPGAYVGFTSFTHHPFDAEVPIDVPDNWAGHRAWNVPLDELIAITRGAIEAGFTVAWDGDVSERGFRSSDGVAFLPTSSLRGPGPELEVTQELRQRLFDSQETTDDHLMHMTGLARDQRGTLYFTTKNSYGSDGSDLDGYVQVSEAYARAKTISILLHVDGVPADTARRLGLRRRDR